MVVGQEPASQEEGVATIDGHHPVEFHEVYDMLFLKTGRHELYPYQRQLLEDKSKFIVINKSRQTGISSFLACHGLVIAVLMEKTVLIISPSERQSKHVMDYVSEYWRVWKAQELPWYLPEVTEETKHSLSFSTGGRIHCLPNSPSTIRGFRADLVMLDEFAHFLNGTDREVFEALTPSISRGGTLIIVSTPYGDLNLFRDLWFQDDPNIKKLLIPYTMCPDLRVEQGKIGTVWYVGGVRYDDVSFRQEFCNEFVGELSSEFPMSLIMPCVDTELMYSTAPELHGKIVVGGYDVARDVDLSVVHLYELTYNPEGKPTYTLRGRWRWIGVPYNDQYAQLKEILRWPNIKWFNMDATAEKALHERIRQDYPIIRGVHFTNDIKQKMVQSLKKIYEERRIKIPDEPTLVRAINSIQRKYSSANYLKFEADRDDDIGHADEFWAQALALYEGTEMQMGAGTIGMSNTATRALNQKSINEMLGWMR